MIAPGSGSSNGTGHHVEPDPPARRGPSRAMLAISALIVGTVLLSLFAWRGSWFGRELSVEQIRKYLTDVEHPRKTQHALEQFTRQMDVGNTQMRELYPLVADLVRHDRPEVRGMAAWAMGWDNQHEPFHEALRELVLDPSPVVHRNAALALSKFGDRAARPVLRAMLLPYTMKSPAGGVISKLLARGTPVKAHMTVGEIAAERQEPRQIAAPVDGRVSRAFVENGATVAAGDPLYEFAPADRDMKEAMRALVLVGGPEDIELVRDAMNSSAASREVAEQGSLTIKALENRATNGAATGFDTPAGRSDANTNG